MTLMHKSILLTIIVLSLFSCEEYENKEKYDVEIGEEFEIYYSTNSCCQVCLVNEEDLKNIKFVEHKMIDPGPEDCMGCNYTASYVFKAMAKGVDTIKIKYTIGGDDCINSKFS